MAAQFHVKGVSSLGGSLALLGEITKGKIQEGDLGSTWENKRFKVIKISGPVGSRTMASAPSIVTISIRNLTRGDVSPGDVIFVE